MILFADNLCKQFGPTLGPTCLILVSKLFDTDEILKKLNLKKKKQPTKKACKSKHAKELKI